MGLLVIILFAMFCVAATIPIWVMWAILSFVINGPPKPQEEPDDIPIYGSRDG